MSKFVVVNRDSDESSMPWNTLEEARLSVENDYDFPEICEILEVTNIYNVEKIQEVKINLHIRTQESH